MTNPITPAFGATVYLADDIPEPVTKETVTHRSLLKTSDNRSLLEQVRLLVNIDLSEDDADILLDEIQSQMERLGFKPEDQRLAWENIASIHMAPDYFIDVALKKADELVASSEGLKRTHQAILEEYKII